MNLSVYIGLISFDMKGEPAQTDRMKIIAGQWRGKALQAPPGANTRPTAARAREALFNRLAHAPWSPGIESAHVLDLFAGTGAFGLEALSRGASHATFVERDSGALRALKANIASCRCQGQALVIAGDAMAAIPLSTPVDIVFADAPYKTGAGSVVLAALPTSALTPSGIAVIEVAQDETAMVPTGWQIVDERAYGAAKFVVLIPVSG
jgi:16S rRNA (guanine966-N2)-methyltransferase